jgi:hypothetical protein
MRIFNLEAARRGEPIQAKIPEGRMGDPLWFDATFVGVDRVGRVVIESAQYGLERVSLSDLRMAPRQVTIFIEVWLDDRSGRFASRVVHPDGYASDACLSGEKIDTISYVRFE